MHVGIHMNIRSRHFLQKKQFGHSSRIHNSAFCVPDSTSLFISFVSPIVQFR